MGQHRRHCAGCWGGDAVFHALVQTCARKGLRRFLRCNWIALRGILFFQGWRLDPILQFGQFLLAGTTVFFAYESVRLRGVATEQARRSAYFDDEPAPIRNGSGPGGLRGGWDEEYDRFDEPQPLRRRFSGRDEMGDEQPQDDFYKPRQTSRAAIPEEAVSRRGREPDNASQSWDRDNERSRRMARFRAGEERSERRSDLASAAWNATINAGQQANGSG